MLKELNKTDSSELKFMAYDLHPLFQSLKPWEHVDRIDTRYLNQVYAQLLNSLKTHLILSLNHFQLPNHHSLINILYPPVPK